MLEELKEEYIFKKGLKDFFDSNMNLLLHKSKLIPYIPEYIASMKNLETYFDRKSLISSNQSLENEKEAKLSKIDGLMLFTLLFAELGKDLLNIPLPKLEIMLRSLANIEIDISWYPSIAHTVFFNETINRKMQEVYLSPATQVDFYTEYLYHCYEGNFRVEDALEDLENHKRTPNELFPSHLFTIQMIYDQVVQNLMELDGNVHRCMFTEEDYKRTQNILKIKKLSKQSKNQYIDMIQIYDKMEDKIIIKIKDILEITDEFVMHHDFLETLDPEKLFIYMQEICTTRVGTLQDCFKKR